MRIFSIGAGMLILAERRRDYGVPLSDKLFPPEGRVLLEDQALSVQHKSIVLLADWHYSHEDQPSEILNSVELIEARA